MQAQCPSQQQGTFQAIVLQEKIDERRNGHTADAGSTLGQSEGQRTPPFEVSTKENLPRGDKRCHAQSWIDKKRGVDLIGVMEDWKEVVGR